MSYETIRYTVEAGVATITLNRPEVLNAINRTMLAEIRAGLADMAAFDKEPVEALLKSIGEKRGLKMGKVAQPLRVAVTGTDQSPPMHETLAVVGRERALSRIDAALARI